MKVFAITRKNRILAICEDKEPILQWYLQNNMSKPEYMLHKIKDIDMCNKLLLLYGDTLYVEDYDDYAVRYCDTKPIEDLAYSIQSDIYDLSERLESISSYIDISTKKEDIISKASIILYDHVYNINIVKVVNDYYEAIGLRNPNIYKDISV